MQDIWILFIKPYLLHLTYAPLIHLSLLLKAPLYISRLNHSWVLFLSYCSCQKSKLSTEYLLWTWIIHFFSPTFIRIMTIFIFQFFAINSSSPVIFLHIFEDSFCICIFCAPLSLYRYMIFFSFAHRVNFIEVCRRTGGRLYCNWTIHFLISNTFCMIVMKATDANML